MLSVTADEQLFCKFVCYSALARGLLIFVFQIITFHNFLLSFNIDRFCIWFINIFCYSCWLGIIIMKLSSQFLVCSVDHTRPQDSLGTLVEGDRLYTPMHADIFVLLQHYLFGEQKLAGLSRGQGIATISCPVTISIYRRQTEVVRPLLMSKIAQLSPSEQALWHALLYREQLKLCLVLSPRAQAELSRLDGLRLLTRAVRSRRGRVFSVVAQDPVRDHVKEVLRLAKPKRRFSVVSCGTGRVPKGVQIVQVPDHPIVGHALVQRYLGA